MVTDEDATVLAKLRGLFVEHGLIGDPWGESLDIRCKRVVLLAEYGAGSAEPRPQVLGVAEVVTDEGPLTTVCAPNVVCSFSPVTTSSTVRAMASGRTIRRR